MKYYLKLGFCYVLCLFWLQPNICSAMPPGTLLYRTSANAKMYGYSQDPLIEIDKGILKNVYSGHAAIYIGRENGEDYIIEAMGDGLVKTPAKYFVNLAEGETFLGARMPKKVTALQQAKVVALAKSLVSHKLAYDYSFSKQKGPDSGDWTCVGLTEKLYESANISNPNNLASLEYDEDYYAVNITPDGFDNYSKVNKLGDCFSKDKEFSKIARRQELLIPAPELIGYDLGLEYDGERYIFLPYTQFLQNTLEPVAADVVIASSFSGPEVRGNINVASLVLRWSLVNNPLSSLSNLAQGLKEISIDAFKKTKNIVSNLGKSIFGDENSTEIVYQDDDLKDASTDKEENKASVKITKADLNKSAPTPESKATVASSENKKNKTASSTKVTAEVAAAKTASSTAVKKTAKEKSNPVVSNSNKVNQQIVQAKNTDKKLAASSTNSTLAYYNHVTVHAASVPATVVSSSTSTSPVNTNNIPSSIATNTVLTKIKINRIYSTSGNDFIELVNSSSQDLDLAAAGIRLEKTKTAEDPSLLFRFGDLEDGEYPGGTIIKAGSKYLITGRNAYSFYKNQAAALVDREGFSWGSSGYTIYLGRGPISSSNDADIIDAVGFGPNASYYQGSGPAPEIIDNYILSRVYANNNNALDFKLTLANDPSYVLPASDQNQSTSSTEINVNEEINSSSTIITASSSVATTTNINYSALINKIYSTGDNDWVELLNNSDLDFDLAAANFRLEKSKSGEDPSLLIRFGNIDDAQYPGGTIIKAHDKYLIMRDEANDYFKQQADAISLRDEFSWTGSGYTLYLGDGPISSSTDENIIDAVGYGPDATYYKGTGPALEILDNYILNRINETNNNQLDFNLILSGDPSIASSTATSSEPNLSTAQASILSPGLTDLWHFDECYGIGGWEVGRWECARSLDYNYATASGTTNKMLDYNSFSAAFYYKGVNGNSRVYFELPNNVSADNSINLNLHYGMIIINNLPNSEGRYYLDTKIGDGLWHQLVLVVNQANDYWSLYIDGQEIIREEFFADLNNFSSWQASNGSDAFLFDELAFWDRPLASGEILANFLAGNPFAPFASKPSQAAPELKHFWDFEEDTGTTTVDSIGGSILSVGENDWYGRSHNNYALNIISGQEVAGDLNESLSSDLSITLWWKNAVFPQEGRLNLYLLDSDSTEVNIFALIVDNFRQSYWFNSNYGVFSEGLDLAIPNDDQWHHLAMVYDSYRYLLNFYVDGIKKGSKSLIWMKPGHDLEQLKIYSNSYSATIDELGLWSGALNEAQIMDIYTNNK